ncbi:hypothetical protein TI04_09495, partial [Achromatium sp. WMS2]
MNQHAQLEKLATDQLTASWLRYYYRHTAEETLVEKDLAQVYSAAITHLEFAKHRTVNQVKLRIYNPESGNHGWKCPHTIVELVANDMPFLVDSMCMEIHRNGVAVLETFQSIIPILRDSAGYLQDIVDESTDFSVPREAVVKLKLVRQVDLHFLESLRQALLAVLADVSAAVQDRDSVQAELNKLQTELKIINLPDYISNQRTETIEFLHWLLDHHFTFLGTCYYSLTTQSYDGPKLGIFRYLEPTALAAMF